MERPLVLRCGALGDMVLLTALIRPLYARFGQPVDIIASGPWSRPLLAGQPGVGRVLSVRSRKAPYWSAPDQWEVARWLRSRPPGPTWFCDVDAEAYPMIRRAHLSPEYVVHVRDHARREGEHTVEQWHRLAAEAPPALRGSALAAPREVVPGCELAVSEAQRSDLDSWLRARGVGATPLLAVQAGNKRTMRSGLRRLAVNHKYWPGERWAQVLRFLHGRHPAHRLVLLGTGPEQRLNDELIAAAGVADIVNAADDLPVPRLVALLERTAGLVTVDSGPAHVAAAVACPQVVLFGKALPSLYRPWGARGAPVRVLTGVVDGEPDMSGITVGEVIQAWESLPLRPAHAARTEPGR